MTVHSELQLIRHVLMLADCIRAVPLVSLQLISSANTQSVLLALVVVGNDAGQAQAGAHLTQTLYWQQLWPDRMPAQLLPDVPQRR